MKSTKAANRYALSLIDLAKETSKLDSVKNDMVLIHSTIDENRDLSLMLSSPIIKADAKNSVLENIFGKSTEVLSLSFMKLLTVKGRENILQQIAAAFIKLYRKEKGIINAEIISAVPLTDDWRQNLKDVLASSDKSIDLTETVDESLLGGLRIKIGDQLVDASIRRKLNEIKQEISNQKLSVI